MNTPKISVIIPTLNESGYITTLLKALSNQSFQSAEIIVVDAASTDSTIAEIKKFKTVRLYQGNPPVASQRNLGAGKASGDILIFLDADTSPSADFIQKAVKHFNKSDLDATCPWFIPDSKNPFLWLIYLFFSSCFFLFQYFLPSGAASCLIVRKKIFLKEKGFDSQYKFEDIELIRRLGNKYTFRILPQILKVSPRRFYSQGIFITLIKYLLLSLLFCFNLFKLANNIEYSFGNHRQKK